MKAIGTGWIGIVKRAFGFSDNTSKTPVKTSKTYTDKDRIAAWAYHNCERENAKWLGTDPMNICPLRGNCPRCQEEAREAVLEQSS